jgi:hypothetical protein
MSDAIISVQRPGASGKVERYNRAVADGSSDDAIRAALETILANDKETLLKPAIVKPRDGGWGKKS